MSTTETKDYGITFDGEAYEWFQRFVADLGGLTVRITPEENGEPFDAVIAIVPERDPFAVGWATEISVRRFDEETGNATGPVFNVRAQTVHVY